MQEDTHTQTYTHIHKSEDLTKNLEENIADTFFPRKNFITLLFYFYGRLPNVENKNMSCLAKCEFQISI